MTTNPATCPSCGHPIDVHAIGNGGYCTGGPAYGAHGCDGLTDEQQSQPERSGPAFGAILGTPPRLEQLMTLDLDDQLVGAGRPTRERLEEILTTPLDPAAFGLDPATYARPSCPECAAGKCGNCDGTTWDLTVDEPATCPCSARQHATDETTHLPDDALDRILDALHRPGSTGYLVGHPDPANAQPGDVVNLYPVTIGDTRPANDYSTIVDDTQTLPADTPRNPHDLQTAANALRGAATLTDDDDVAQWLERLASAFEDEITQTDGQETQP
jgi:hypothetical protein